VISTLYVCFPGALGDAFIINRPGIWLYSFNSL